MAQVLSALDCPPPDCVHLDEAREMLGFAPFEPQVLPEEFKLVARTLQPSEGPERPGDEEARRDRPVSRVVAYLQTAYRFRSSVNPPGMIVLQSRQAPPNGAISLTLQGDGCGEVTSDSQGQVFYTEGFAALQPSGEYGAFLLCKIDEVPARRSHTVLVSRGSVLIQILAFPESGVTKDEILAAADSLTQAE